MRRDGFAAMIADEKGGTLTTERLQYHGNHFFVNADCSHGELWVELLDEGGHPLPGYSRNDCFVVHNVDNTKIETVGAEHSTHNRLAQDPSHPLRTSKRQIVFLLDYRQCCRKKPWLSGRRFS